MHAIIPQNDQDECLGALSTVEDGDPCFVGMGLDVWGNSCLVSMAAQDCTLKLSSSKVCQR